MDADALKKRIKEIKEENPAYYSLLEDPEFRLIPTIDQNAIPFLTQSKITNIITLAFADSDEMIERFLQTKNHLAILNRWMDLPGNVSLIRDAWDDEEAEKPTQDQDEFDIENLEFPCECAECHKKIKENNHWALRIDNKVLCKSCSSFYTECVGCSKIFQPDYSAGVEAADSDNLCPDCVAVEKQFAAAVKKMKPPQLLDKIFTSWIEAAQDYITQKNMHWYLKLE
jgi:hypothetical protein